MSAGAPCLSPGFAQAEPSIALHNDEFNEVIRPAARISGAVLMGVQRRNLSDEHDLRAYVPERWKETGQLCAQVVSIDGRYEAVNTYDLPAGWPGGVEQLPFPTKHADLLGSQPEDGLAVLVSGRDCGTPSNGEYSVALWNAQMPEQIELLINAFRAEQVFLYVEGRDLPIRCEPIKRPMRTAFDTTCSLLVENLSGEVDLELFRMVDRKPAPPDRFTILFPD
jgi:hypothetical protein